VILAKGANENNIRATDSEGLNGRRDRLPRWREMKDRRITTMGQQQNAGKGAKPQAAPATKNQPKPQKKGK
jgi:hypothetical protein